MTATEAVLLVVAGIGAGLTGSVAGLASLVSYPAVLAVGLPPLSANVTNTVALVFSSIGSTLGSRRELQGQAPRLRRLVPFAVLGGIAGGALLLATPNDAFKRIVPVLIGLASVAILLPRRARADPHAPDSARALPAAMFAVGVYGGYFGAAAGVVLLAVLLAATGDTLARSNAVKNVTLGAANAVAAVGFALFGPVRWEVCAPLAVGLLIGGTVGPAVVRRVPATPLRVVIALAGVGLAVRLGVQAYR